MDLRKGSGFESADILSAPLCAIYLRCIADGVYPKLFEVGQVTPIFKAGHKNNVKNYRSVNVPPNSAKIHNT